MRPIVRLGGAGSAWRSRRAGRPSAAADSAPSESAGAEDVLVQLAQRLPRLDAELVDEPCAGRRNAASASACRPQRYSASICSPSRRSLNGCAITSASSRPRSSPCRPSSRSSSIASIARARCSSSSRAPRGIEQLVPAGSLQRRSTPQAERLLDRHRASRRFVPPRVPGVLGRVPPPSDRRRGSRAPDPSCSHPRFRPTGQCRLPPPTPYADATHAFAGCHAPSPAAHRPIARR